MKKIFAIILALAMTFALSATALADPPTTGTITISNAVPGQTYSIYKMFDVETYTGEGDNVQVVYKVVAAWASFFAEPDNSDPENPVPAGPGYEYIHLDVNGHPTWVKTYDHDEDSNTPEAPDTRAETMQAFAAAALAWATDHSITATKTAVALAFEGDPPTPPAVPRVTVVFDELALGYYLIDSTLGALCTITTIHPTATVEDKNPPPTVVKTPDDTDTGVGDEVTYTATIAHINGQTHVVFKDTMTGLEFVEGSLDVYKNSIDDANAVADTNYTFAMTADPYGFTVSFEDDFIETLTASDTIILVYRAKVTDAAVSQGADNTAEVTYNNGGSTTGNQPSPKVHNIYFDIFKYEKGEGDAKTGLQNATFRLSRAAGQATETAYWKVDADGNYILEGWGALPDPNSNNYTYDLVSGSDGYIHVKGLGSGTYTLNETVAPSGYNLLTDPITVTITYVEPNNENPNGAYTIQYKIGAGEMSDAPVEVLNQKGGELPGVGGIGTTIFYIIGALLMVGAAVLLIVRKKMSVMD